MQRFIFYVYQMSFAVEYTYIQMDSIPAKLRVASSRDCAGIVRLCDRQDLLCFEGFISFILFCTNMHFPKETIMHIRK